MFGVPVGAPVPVGNEGASPPFAPGPVSGKRYISYFLLDFIVVWFWFVPVKEKSDQNKS